MLLTTTDLKKIHPNLEVDEHGSHLLLHNPGYTNRPFLRWPGEDLITWVPKDVPTDDSGKPLDPLCKYADKDGFAQHVLGEDPGECKIDIYFGRFCEGNVMNFFITEPENAKHVLFRLTYQSDKPRIAYDDSFCYYECTWQQPEPTTYCLVIVELELGDEEVRKAVATF